MELDTQTRAHCRGGGLPLPERVQPSGPRARPRPAPPRHGLDLRRRLQRGQRHLGGLRPAEVPGHGPGQDQVPSADVTGCYVLLQVLLVTFNYRLGSLGWISLGQGEESVLGTVTSHHDMT